MLLKVSVPKMIPCVDDLIHLEDPIEEDSVVRALQARFFNQKYFVRTYPKIFNLGSNQISKTWAPDFDNILDLDWSCLIEQVFCFYFFDNLKNGSQ